MFDCYQACNSPADIAPHLHNKEWLQRALCKDQQAAGLLPSELLGGPILHGACARAECNDYRDWKWAVDAMWEDERHRQTAARQCLLNKQAARKKQEAARCQRLLDERASSKRQEAACKEAAHHQRLLDEETARHFMAERTALA